MLRFLYFRHFCKCLYKTDVQLKIEIVMLSDLVCETQKDLRNREAVTRAVRSSVMSKQYGNEDFLAKLIADACGTSSSDACSCIGHISIHSHHV